MHLIHTTLLYNSLWPFSIPLSFNFFLNNCSVLRKAGDVYTRVLPLLHNVVFWLFVFLIHFFTISVVLFAVSVFFAWIPPFSFRINYTVLIKDFIFRKFKWRAKRVKKYWGVDLGTKSTFLKNNFPIFLTEHLRHIWIRPCRGCSLSFVDEGSVLVSICLPHVFLYYHIVPNLPKFRTLRFKGKEGKIRSKNYDQKTSLFFFHCIVDLVIMLRNVGCFT